MSDALLQSAKEECKVLQNDLNHATSLYHDERKAREKADADNELLRKRVAELEGLGGRMAEIERERELALTGRAEAIQRAAGAEAKVEDLQESLVKAVSERDEAVSARDSLATVVQCQRAEVEFLKGAHSDEKSGWVRVRSELEVAVAERDARIDSLEETVASGFEEGWNLLHAHLCKYFADKHDWSSVTLDDMDPIEVGTHAIGANPIDEADPAATSDPVGNVSEPPSTSFVAESTPPSSSRAE